MNGVLSDKRVLAAFVARPRTREVSYLKMGTAIAPKQNPTILDEATTFIGGFVQEGDNGVVNQNMRMLKQHRPGIQQAW